jgi:hypothetical protein
MADHEQDNHDRDPEEEQEENEGPRGARRRRGAEVPLDALLRLLAGQRVVVRGREAAGGNEELIAGLKRSGMLSRCESDGCNAVQPQFRRLCRAPRPVRALILLQSVSATVQRSCLRQRGPGCTSSSAQPLPPDLCC